MATRDGVLNIKGGPCCFHCLRPAVAATRANGKDVPYCAAHKPRVMVAFQEAAWRAMRLGHLRGKIKSKVAESSQGGSHDEHGLGSAVRLPG